MSTTHDPVEATTEATTEAATEAETPLTFHVPGIWHTRLSPQFSHCAFTTKVRLLPRTLRSAFPDAKIIVYCAHDLRDETYDAVRSDATLVSLLSDADQERLLGHRHDDPFRFVGTDARWDSPLYVCANALLRAALAERLATPGRHLILHPFGPAHRDATQGLPALQVESGIGYTNPYLPFRVYESLAWQHHIAGLEHRQGTDYEWVVPPTIDIEEWHAAAPDMPTPDRPTFVTLGRLNEDKGVRVLFAVARALSARWPQREGLPEPEFVWYGQGDWSRWAEEAPPNVRYGGVLQGVEARAGVLAQANALIMPSRFIEPGAQAHVEALAMGVPVLGPAHGIFTETVVPGINGQLCRTLGDWVSSCVMAATGEFAAPHVIRADANGRFGVEAHAQEWQGIVRQLLDLYDQGWYTLAPRNLYAPPRDITSTRAALTFEAQRADKLRPLPIIDPATAN